MHILDFIADYYWRNRDHAKEWDALFVPIAGWREAMRARKKTLLTLFVAALLLGLGAVGWMLRDRIGMSEAVRNALEGAGIIAPRLPEKSSEVVPETPAEQAPPTEATTTPEIPPTEQPPVEVKKENYPIRISNGTRVAGEAGRLRTALQSAGFTVLSVGNHEDQNQTLTTLFVGSNAPDAITSEIQALLEKTYQTVAISASPIPVEDIHIVIGKKK